MCRAGKGEYEHGAGHRRHEDAQRAGDQRPTGDAGRGVAREFEPGYVDRAIVGAEVEARSFAGAFCGRDIESIVSGRGFQAAAKAAACGNRAREEHSGANGATCVSGAAVRRTTRVWESADGVGTGGERGEDLAKFHDVWIRPNDSTLIVVGDTTLAEMTPKLEKLFAGWKAGKLPAKNVGTVQMAPKSVVYLVDKPGALQSVIIAGHVAPPTNNPKEIAIDAMNDGLGGNFAPRFTMNLREHEHWPHAPPWLPSPAT